MPQISDQIEGYNRLDRAMILGLRREHRDYFCFKLEGSPENIQEQYAIYPKPSEITPEFIKSHLFIHKDALANSERTQYEISYRGGGEIGQPTTLPNAIRQMNQQWAEILRATPNFSVVLTTFKITQAP